MFLRFAISKQDCVSRQPAGVFMAAWELRHSGRLSDPEEDHLIDVLCWFGSHLKVPRRFSVRGISGDKAICWFKPTAQIHVEKMWEIVWVLEHHDVGVQMLTTSRPGYIAYEDEAQVAAVPFRDTIL